MSIFKKIDAVVRIAAFVVWTVALIALLVSAHLFCSKKKDAVLKLFHAGVCRIFRITIKIEGKISDKAKTIYVANHASYIDIPILGSVLEGQFVAKSDVAKWPIIGWLARLQNTIYIERRASQAKKQVAQLGKALTKGGNLIIFPEGTNTLGDEVKPFKASLFGEAVMAERPVIQPVAVTYHRPDGAAIEPERRPLYGWPLGDGFGPHFWQFIQQGGMHVTLTFYTPFSVKEGSDRKELLAAAHNLIEKTVLKVT